MVVYLCRIRLILHPLLLSYLRRKFSPSLFGWRGEGREILCSSLTRQTPHLSSPPVFLATNYTASKRASRREAAAHYFHRITLCTPSLLLLALTSLASNSFGGTIGSGRRRQRKKERREDRGGRGGISLSTSWEWSCSRRDGGGATKAAAGDLSSASARPTPMVDASQTHGRGRRGVSGMVAKLFY